MLGERLKIARRAAGLSQRALAALVGVSAMAVSNYEREENWPGSDVLLRLGGALGVAPDYFLRPVEARVSGPLHGCRPPLPARQRDRLIAQTTEWAQRYLEVLALFPDEPEAPDLPPRRHVERPEDAEPVAEELRRYWGLGEGPLGGLIAVLEDHRLMVGVVDICDPGDAATMLVNDEWPAIVMGGHAPGDRQRVSVAHQLGRLVMDAADSLAEDAASRFAAAFLAPRSRVMAELASRPAVSLGRLYVLKHKYGLSMRAWIRRAEDLGLLDLDEAQDLRQQLVRHGRRDREPYEQVAPEEPARMRRLVHRALAEDLLSPARASELLLVTSDELALRGHFELTEVELGSRG